MRRDGETAVEAPPSDRRSEGLQLLARARQLQAEQDKWESTYLLMGRGCDLDLSPLERIKAEKREVGRRLKELGMAAVA